MENITVQNENNTNGQSSTKNNLLVLAILGFATAIIVAGMYILLAKNQIYVEDSQIVAPMIDLSSQNGGKLEKMYVNPGDNVTENQIVAQVGQELVKTKDSGIIITTEDDMGKIFQPGEAVVTMIKPDDLRVVAQIEEDKGLSEVTVGQRAFFTVDAFGSKKFDGIVDEVSPTSRQSDVVFNISSQRQEQEFNIKIRFDVNKYPELKNGMSAKSWIYKD
jgi:multidrug resistance efflux pump